MTSPERRLRCDFCGKAVSRVRRIALDPGYDRLSRVHAARFACEPCSRRKEAERQSDPAPAGAGCGDPAPAGAANDEPRPPTR